MVTAIFQLLGESATGFDRASRDKLQTKSRTGIGAVAAVATIGTYQSAMQAQHGRTAHVTGVDLIGKCWNFVSRAISLAA